MRRADSVLSVEELSIALQSGPTTLRIVDSVSFTIKARETLALVGESGSGKTTTALAIMRLAPGGRSAIASGHLWFNGRDLAKASDAEMRSIRGGPVVMVFQDPLTALDPLVTIGRQVECAIRVHSKLRRRKRRARAVELLRDVGIPDASSCFRRYPHEYSGGMRQRVLIAMAMANRPRLYIADEPTTALDVTVQAQVLDALERAQAETEAAMLLITHDLGIVAERADRMAVMYAGRLVEQGPVQDLLTSPRHPYTLGLLSCTRRVGERQERIATIPGQPATVDQLPGGCAFHPRCAWATDSCRHERPELASVGHEHQVACFRHDEVAVESQPLLGGENVPGGPTR